MELVEAILYKKINPGDLLNIDLALHSGGGGQTYLDLAGISESILCRFLEYGTIIERSNPPLGDTRKKIAIEAVAIGTNLNKRLEFDPRNNRPNYKLSDQRGNRHPAWTSTFGFPQAPQDARYAKDVTNVEDLIIYIIKTNSQKYYAGFVNLPNLPQSWPTGVGFEALFTGDRRGVLFLDTSHIAFVNDAKAPFSLLTTICDIDIAELPDDIPEQSVDAVEYIDTDLEAIISTRSKDFVYFQTEPPILKQSKTSISRRTAKKVNHEKGQKNKVIIGKAGEEAAYFYEKQRLTLMGRSDLSEQVEWVSQTQGDGLGYDIHSFDICDGNVIDLYIEVKTTTGGISKPFDISKNEVDFSKENMNNFLIFRIYEFRIEGSTIKFYSKFGSVFDNFEITPTSYSALPK